MQTSDLLLAAFVKSLHVDVRKVTNEEDVEVFEFALDVADPIVAQFTAPDGYNCNINAVANAVTELEAMECYVAPEVDENANEETKEETTGEASAE